jgi:hypothetical protein
VAGVLEDLLDEVRTLREEVTALREGQADALLDSAGAADVLSMPESAVLDLAYRRRTDDNPIPAFKMPNGKLRFERAALLAWAKGQAS